MPGAVSYRLVPDANRFTTAQMLDKSFWASADAWVEILFNIVLGGWQLNAAYLETNRQVARRRFPRSTKNGR